MPAYVIAYIYTDLFDYAGPVQRFLRDIFAWQSPQDYWFFDIRSLFGAALMIALVLFPYVYMLVRTAFECQDPQMIRAARSLGLNARQTFFKVSLPLARPAIAISASLVLMETLADFATVQYFAVNTLTTAIYDTWLEYGELSTANAIASVLLIFVLIVLVSEQRARAKQSHQVNSRQHIEHVYTLTGIEQIAASAFCWGLVVFGFLLPCGILLDMAWRYFDVEQFNTLLSSGLNSLEVSFYVASIASVLALLFVLFRRLSQVKLSALPLKISGLGYAIPGTVLAMAMLATFGPLDHVINDLAVQFGFNAPGLVLSGSAFAIVFALVTRFSAIANGTIASGVEQIPQSLDYAPASLGVGLWQTIRQVHIPLLKSSFVVAWLLVFVEAMKELPAVLVLRPFNFDTLSTHIYQMISDERLEQGAIGAILIVAFGLIPIVILNKKEKNH
ncbi:iron(III) ABC transporter permease [Thalassotalea marina]|uniref:Iron(III) ABC transporter permease n=2 Tax=Thalassotalea marina TaxID=1673741 RepID=A0A919EGA3_9GAMM|nr:iron(III) ABC transporter permease [Thalassotalea marina]